MQCIKDGEITEEKCVYEYGCCYKVNDETGEPTCHKVSPNAKDRIDQKLSYVVATWGGKEDNRKSPIDYSMYMSHCIYYNEPCQRKRNHN